jgi:hypothetical protein
MSWRAQKLALRRAVITNVGDQSETVLVGAPCAIIFENARGLLGNIRTERRCPDKRSDIRELT